MARVLNTHQPIEHGTLTQCWLHAGLTYSLQCWPNTEPAPGHQTVPAWKAVTRARVSMTLMLEVCSFNDGPASTKPAQSLCCRKADLMLGDSLPG